MQTTPLALLNVARTLATEAGRIVAAGRTADLRVTDTKSSDIDIVTQVDIACEDFLRTRIAELRPNDAILGEEGADVPGTSGVTWVLDPIDGTVNYLYGLPHFAVSVGAVTGPANPDEWTQEAGAVFEGGDKVLWSAARGEGAWRDGVQIEPHQGPPLSATLLGTGFQYIAKRRALQGAVVTRMLSEVRDIRRLGSCSVDLCLAAAGTLDAYYEHGLGAWDHAAAGLIAREAGLRVEGLNGNPANGELLIAAPANLFDALYDALVASGADRMWDA